MPRFVVLWGRPEQPMQETFEGPSPEAVRDHLVAEGKQPLGFQSVDVQNLPSTRTTTSTTTGFSPADLAQIAAGGIGTSVGGPALGVPAALGARLAFGIPDRPPRTAGGGPEHKPVLPTGRGTAGARELLRGGPAEAAALLLPQALRKGGELLEFVRGPRTLPALTRTAEAVGPQQAARVLAPEVETAAGRATQSTAQTLRRAFGPIFRREVGGAPAIHATLTEGIGKLATGDRERALLEILNATDLRLDKITTATLQTAIRTRPGQLLEAAQLLGKHVGDADLFEAVRQQVARRLVSDAFRRALVRPPRTPFPEAFEGKVLDPVAFGKGLDRARRALGLDGTRLAFGAEGVRELDLLTQKLGGAKMARELALAARGRAPELGLPEQLYRRVIRPRLFGRALTLGMSHALGLGGVGEMAALATEESIGEMLGHLSSTPAGLRWIAAGIDLQRRGFPDRLIIPGLARAVPNLLSALGIGPARENMSLAFGLGLGATLPQLVERHHLAPPARSGIP